MAKKFGVTLRTLRFYEDKGLLSPQRDGTTRLYSRRDRARLKLILLGRKVGFSLRDVKQIMDLYDPNGTNTKQLRTRARQIGEAACPSAKAADSCRRRHQRTDRPRWPWCAQMLAERAPAHGWPLNLSGQQFEGGATFARLWIRLAFDLVYVSLLKSRSGERFFVACNQNSHACNKLTFTQTSIFVRSVRSTALHASDSGFHRAVTGEFWEEY